ncbi:hypothetical protein AN3023.2 [Aspergillus nidulans FGSC A4]|uniref:Phytase-like domain-containing protein n=1 Tax=Emericella nidulans (strain FGSC A4 / ATCC 38163 / CBS 112.46 / NRRL 194 / M139) TaxID=227321 RepID=Q5B8V7_EMENI|nr:hypothetical protein [Aspergillus nidulans FGSC A4]EAA63594.1 hypothetical protein AN3023.2 [Aspergillus nidulans FGSC A4]CBF83548.1 TPA: conserved hypothetical protein [Aspergillus nidulans FGSC A4]|eukprot:XP_660627.1 hypothetical protein AN3023.2 [Aspergillus nidulans FGSC A4]
MKWSFLLKTLPLTAASAVAAPGCSARYNLTAVNTTTCGGITYTYIGLDGYGFVESNVRDKYGDTLAGLGSSAVLEKGSWHKKSSSSYSGIFYLLPDRGWNTNGTLNFNPRIHKFELSLTLVPRASAQTPSKPNLAFKYLDTILLTDPRGKPLTGLDPDFTGNISYPGYPPLPAATYVGDGFGGAGSGGKRVALDSEGLAIDQEGYFWVSDEYGPYIYRFNKNGKMVLALQPPEAYLPRRNGLLSFSAASAPLYTPDKLPNPEDPESGRNNNQGFEALTISPDGRTLTVMIQSALNQEGGPKKKYRQPARLLQYDISNPNNPQYKHDNFLILSRDSGFGAGLSETLSVYRQADIFSISNSTTDLKVKEYNFPRGSIASSEGILDTNITPAEYCPFLDFNINSELAKFGLHNGGEQDSGLLNEKWESLVLVPVEPENGQNKGKDNKTEYFLFSFSDNDFITQDGAMNFGRLPYADESGFNLNSQALVFRDN